MSDLIGKTFGPYRILEQIGVGGMATVYRAYQPSMDRDVAIKVLPHYLSEDKQFAERFQREAHAIAKLEHPHILPVHDYGEADGVTYIAMRYVQAGTLKELMSKERLSLDEINRLLGQIGSALDYAHSQGVIHRDIKPSNVLIDPQGNTYLTDFGLARMLEASQQLTASGVGLGTPAYMSPEQGQGIKVDHRSDLYSLGVMLYEMVTGRVPYQAETPMAVVLKHITDPLPLPRAVAPDVPEVIEKVILRAMAKDPAHRFQSANDLVQALNQAVRKVSPPEPAGPTVIAEAMATREHIPLVTRIQRMQVKPRSKVALAVGAVAVLAVLGLLFGQLPPVAPRATAMMTLGPTGGVVVTIPVPATAEAATPMPTSAPPTATTAPSPLDMAEWLDFCGKDDICILSRSHSDTPLGLNNTHTCFRGWSWSPDGSRIVFSASRLEEPDCLKQGLFVVQRDGSGVVALLDDPNATENVPAWSPDGEWIVYNVNGDLAVARSDGSGKKVLVKNSDTTCPHFGIAWSPDSQRIAWIGGACFVDKQGISDRAWVINRDGTGPRTIFQSADPLLAMDMIAWSPDGRSIAVQLENRTTYLIAADCADSPEGCTESARAEMQAFPDHWRHIFYPQWAGEMVGAPASTPCRIAFVGYEGNYNVHVRNCDGSGVQRVTDLVMEVSAPEHPVWSPDGQAILFVSRHEGNKLSNSTGEPCTSLYIIRPDGDGLARWTRDRCDHHPSWSPDGTRIAFHRECDLAVMNLDGTGTSIIAKPHADLYCIDQSAWSPDGQRIAFTSLKWPSLGVLVEQAVFVASPDGSNLTQLAAVPAENWVEYNVVWSPDGDQIAFSVVQDGLEQYYSVNSDGSNEPTRIIEIPESWYPWYWPRWDKAQTATPDSMADQARAFAEPILQAIADRKADVADDFSAVDKNWSCNGNPLGTTEECRVADGVIRLTPARGAFSDLSHPWMVAGSFVLTIDAREVSGSCASYFQFFVMGPDRWSNLHLNPCMNEASLHAGYGGQPHPELEGSGGSVRPVGEVNHIQVIVRGPRFAYYLNDELVAYFEDSHLDAVHQIGFRCNALPEMVCEFDNVKFWNLDNVPGLP